MKVLVLGGTGFISRRLVDLLLKDGADVTMATSGRTPNPFGDAVEEVKVDRFDRLSIFEKLNSPQFLFPSSYDFSIPGASILSLEGSYALSDKVPESPL